MESQKLCPGLFPPSLHQIGFSPSRKAELGPSLLRVPGVPCLPAGQCEEALTFLALFNPLPTFGVSTLLLSLAVNPPDLLLGSVAGFPQRVVFR